MKTKNLFLVLFAVIFIFNSGCISINKNTPKNGIVGLNIGLIVQSRVEANKCMIKKAFIDAVFGAQYTINNDEAKLDFKSRDIMEKIAYRTLEDSNFNVVNNWNNDYISGTFEIVGVPSAKRYEGKLCKNFVQKISIQGDKFLLNRVACKEDDVWYVK